MNYDQANKPLVITAGEPAGIGPDLCLGLAANYDAAPLVIVADPEQLQRRADLLSQEIAISVYESGVAIATDELCVLPIDLPNKDVCGTPDPANSAALMAGLQRAVAGCQDGEFDALVTGPLQKSAINDGGFQFSGHTEYLSELTSGSRPVMLLLAGDLRVALVSTHLPLREVADYITTERVKSTIRILHDGLIDQFGIENPKINVCGLNPHAGEGGYLGDEDQMVIQPALDALRARGLDLRGPLPADTAFTDTNGPVDAVVAMYHDQGLPVLKYAGFGKAVNVTLGLPIVRTSVDHGTALEIAATGRANPGSLYAAIDTARQLVAR